MEKFLTNEAFFFIIIWNVNVLNNVTLSLMRVLNGKSSNQYDFTITDTTEWKNLSLMKPFQ